MNYPTSGSIDEHKCYYDKNISERYFYNARVSERIDRYSRDRKYTTAIEKEKVTFYYIVLWSAVISILSQSLPASKIRSSRLSRKTIVIDVRYAYCNDSLFSSLSVVVNE